MRNALLVLLLLNFLAYAYQTWILEPDIILAPDYMKQDFPGLMVDKNAADQVAMAKTTDSSGAAARDAGMSCLRIGPFSREADADAVSRALQPRATIVGQTAEEGQVWVGYRVQVDDQDSRAGAEKAREALVAAGIKDAYLASVDGDHRISLGVFRLRSSVNRIVEQASDLGYETRVDDRFQAGTNYWVQVRLAGDRALRPGEFQTDSGRILRTETIACSGAET
jgi:hypothetical protein